MTTALLQEKIFVGPESDGLLMPAKTFDSVEDYDENYQYELVNGVVIVSPIPLVDETGPNDLLAVLLGICKRTHAQGKALDMTVPQQYVRTKKNTRRIADRLIWAGLGRRVNLGADKPTIAVEFVPGRKRDRQRDYVDKRKEYMAIKIPEYWIFDRFQRTLTVIRNSVHGEIEIVVGETETYESPFLPGFHLSVGELLAAADEMVASRTGGKKSKPSGNKRKPKS